MRCVSLVLLLAALACGQPSVKFSSAAVPGEAAPDLARASGGFSLGAVDGAPLVAVGTGYSLAGLIGGKAIPPAQQVLLRRSDDGAWQSVASSLGVAATGGVISPLLADFDGDGDRDLLLPMIDAKDDVDVAASPDLLFEFDGSAFVPRGTLDEAAPGTTYSTCAADFDRDGDLDLFLANHSDLDSFAHDSEGYVVGQKDRLYRNDGAFQFTDVTDASGLGSVTAWSNACLAHDIDDDGDLDLWVAYEQHKLGVTVWRNDGGMKFTDVSEAVIGTSARKVGNWMGFAVGDYDDDGAADVFVTNMGRSAWAIGGTTVTAHPNGTALHLLLRREGAVYRDVARDVPVELETEFPKPQLALPADAKGLAALEFGWSASFGDYDNDGDEDLFFAGAWAFSVNAQIIGSRAKGANPGMLLDNRGGKFAAVGERAGIQNVDDDAFVRNGWGSALVDLTGDGFLDVLLANQGVEDARRPGGLVVWNNEGNDHRALSVTLQGGASGPYGYGAKVTVTTSDGRTLTRWRHASSSIASQDTGALHFGLGNATARSAVVEWPSGAREERTSLETSEAITFTEGA